MTDARSALAKLRPSAGADEHVWAARITACWRASVEAIFEVGRLLAAAKDALPHGKFAGMVEADLPFGARTAERLMAIGADTRLSNPTHVSLLPPSWGTLYELTKLADDEFERKIADGTIRPDMMRRDLAETKQAEPPAQDPPHAAPPADAPSGQPPTIEHDPAEVPVTPEPPVDDEPILPGGNRSIMASRLEPDDSLDFFPTPPWGTRALFEHVLPHLGVKEITSAWDPACGEGHMTAVMEEYVRGPVIGTDIFDYSNDGRSPPAWLRLQDFLDEDAETPVVDLIVSNPPFGKKTEAFVLRALDLAEVGVAMFVRLQWLETIGRYNAIFRDRPPTLLALFCERVNLCKGRWEPDGSTATAYMWLVWLRDREPMPPLWIPPSRRVDLQRKDDKERFTAHPVIGNPISAESIPPDIAIGPVCDEPFDLETGELGNGERQEGDSGAASAMVEAPEGVEAGVLEKAPEGGAPGREEEGQRVASPSATNHVAGAGEMVDLGSPEVVETEAIGGVSFGPGSEATLRVSLTAGAPPPGRIVEVRLNAPVNPPSAQIVTEGEPYPDRYRECVETVVANNPHIPLEAITRVRIEDTYSDPVEGPETAAGVGEASAAAPTPVRRKWSGDDADYPEMPAALVRTV